MFRRLLANILKTLSRWAIKKHNLKIAAIAGTTGTKLTGEMFGEMLSKDHVVRKQLEKPFWDFSIPLTILGIEDRRYKFWEWFGVLGESIKVLILGKSSPAWVVLQMNTLKRDIADYWLNIVEPDLTIIANYNGKLLPFEKKILDKTKNVAIVYPCDRALKIDSVKLVKVGEKEGCDIKIEKFSQSKHGTKFSIRYRGKKYSFVAAQTGIFMKGPILASTSAMISMGKEIEDVIERLRRVEINIDRFIDFH